jgi:glycosyltransferase involved in cell wall biosynthesis
MIPNKTIHIFGGHCCISQGIYVKIGFDISQTGKGKAGCGYLANSLIKEIAQLDSKNQYILYPTFGNFYWDTHFDKIKSISQPNFTQGKLCKTLDESQILWKQPTAAIEEALGNPEILHSNNFFCPEKKLTNTKFIYTLYDLSFAEHPEWTTEQNRVSCFDNMFNASLHADHIIAISAYSKQHFLEFFPHYPEEKISIIYPASRYTLNEQLKKPARLSPLSSGKFWLSVGTIEPRKNHKLLLQAYAKLKEASISSNKELFPLVLSGGMGWMMHDFETCLAELNLTNDVVWLGYTDEQELQWLYQHCYCFLYPSLFEGFGLPVLEAMTCGAPVITSNTSSIPEITGDTALLVDPTNMEMLFDAMKACVDEKVDLSALRQVARQRASVFSWEESARKVLNLYEKVYNDLN